jgi:ornithine decarboxylase
MAKFILSKKKVLEQYNLIDELCDEVVYSFKTNLEVGKILEENTDCCFAVHSIESLAKIKNREKVWFFLQGNIGENLGVNRFVVDNESDLIKLLDHIENEDIKIDLALRLKLRENTIHTGKYFVFGMSSKKINYWVEKLRDNDKINSLGIHFHRKTQNVSEWDLKEELEDALTKETLEKIDFLNIGGGIPCNYKNYNVNVLDEIFNKIKELRKWFKGRLFIEPGRFIAAPSVKLEVEVKNVDGKNIVVDCSIFNSAMDTFLLNTRLKIETELEEGKDYTIKGCTPDSLDIFRYNVKLKNVEVGDKLVFLNAGAYNFHCDFCGLKKLKIEIKN